MKKQLNKIGVQLELTEAIFQEVATFATSIDEAIKLAQEVFIKLPPIWQNAIWEEFGDGVDLSIYGKEENIPSDVYFKAHFSEIYAKLRNFEHRDSAIYYMCNSNYQKKVIELYNNIKLFPMLADYEMPADEVESIKISN